jgi:hypothetical protein
MGTKRSKRFRQRFTADSTVSVDGASDHRETEQRAGFISPKTQDAHCALSSWWMSAWKSAFQAVRSERAGDAQWHELQCLVKIATEERLWELLPEDGPVRASDWLSLLEHLDRSSKPAPPFVYSAMAFWLYGRPRNASKLDGDVWSALLRVLARHASVQHQALGPLLAYAANGELADDECWLWKELDERTWLLLTADETSACWRQLAIKGQLLLASRHCAAVLQRALEALHELERHASMWLSESPQEREASLEVQTGPVRTAMSLINKHQALSVVITRLLRGPGGASERFLRFPAQLFVFESITWTRLDVYARAWDRSPVPPALWLHILPAWHRDILQIWEACIERFGTATLPVVAEWLDQAMNCGPCNLWLHKLLWQACRAVGFAAASAVERCLRAHLEKSISDNSLDPVADPHWLELLTSAYQSPAAWALVDSDITGVLVEKLARFYASGQGPIERRIRIARALLAISYAARDTDALDWLARHIRQEEIIRNALGPLFEVLAHPRGLVLESLSQHDVGASEPHLERPSSLSIPNTTMLYPRMPDASNRGAVGHVSASLVTSGEAQLTNRRKAADADVQHHLDGVMNYPPGPPIPARAPSSERLAPAASTPMELDYDRMRGAAEAALSASGQRTPHARLCSTPSHSELELADASTDGRFAIDNASEASVEALLDQVLESTPSPGPLELPAEPD